MFGKKDLASSDRLETIIGKDTTVSGSISGEGIIRLDGKVLGEEVRHGEVIVGESGEINSDITAKQVTVAGLVKGNIQAEGKVEIVGTGKIIGNIRAANLVISEGALFQGSCDMNFTPKDKDPVSPDKEEPGA